MLNITKIFNNNAILATNETGAELVVLGKGIAFGKKVGELADEALIEKTFSLNKSLFATRLTEILSEIPEVYFQLTQIIVNHAHTVLGKTLSNSIFVSLPDHIFHAVERARNHQSLTNALSFEIQRLYKQEFAIGQFAVTKINQALQVELTDDEAGFIALHIFNARTDNSMQDTYKTMQIIKDILNLVGYHFNQTLNTQSHEYSRFLTHLQHFVQRFLSPEPLPSSGDNFLYEQTQKAYPNAFACVQKIEKYLLKNYDRGLNEDEKLYLMIHIQRVVN